jgi:hypothetical protein
VIIGNERSNAEFASRMNNLRPVDVTMGIFHCDIKPEWSNVLGEQCARTTS